MAKWTFVTNHGSVLALLARASDITVREIASHLAITERSVHRIISDLESEGYLIKERAGRSNRYTVRHHLPLRRSNQRAIAVGELLKLLVPGAAQGAFPPTRTRAYLDDLEELIP